MSVIHPQPIECEGKTFATIKEFANHYGLSYTRVQYYRKQGKTPEEILEACKFSIFAKTTVPKKDSAKRCLCEYDGVSYNSIYEAATALGLSPSYVYDLRKRNNLTASGAIELAMERRKGRAPGAPRHCTKCVVNGVEYESREAAIKAYRIPRITVYSRMEREGISFEEALIRGRNSSTYCPPIVSLFPSMRLVPAKNQAMQPTIQGLYDAIKFYNRPISILTDIVSQSPVLYADECTYIFLNHEAKGIEFISTLPFSLDRDTMDLLNSSYVAAKLYIDPHTKQTCMSAFQSSKEEGQAIKPITYAYFSFACLRDHFISTFGPNMASPEEKDA